jgi:hypothetical protein
MYRTLSQSQMQTRAALTLETPKDSRKKEPQTDKCEDRNKEQDNEIGISADYLRTLEKQINSDKK